MIIYILASAKVPVWAPSTATKAPTTTEAPPTTQALEASTAAASTETPTSGKLVLLVLLTLCDNFPNSAIVAGLLYTCRHNPIFKA